MRDRGLAAMLPSLGSIGWAGAVQSQPDETAARPPSMGRGEPIRASSAVARARGRGERLSRSGRLAVDEHRPVDAGVEARSAVEGVLALVAVEAVVALAPEKVVVPGAARDRVGAVAAAKVVGALA